MTQDLNLNSGTGNQAALPGTESLYQITPLSTPDETQVKGLTSKDSIEKAGEVVASLYLPSMANPILIPPDPNHIAAIGQLAMDKICLDLLDSWSKSLQKIAEDKKEADRKDALNPILQEIHVAGALFFAIATIFIRAIFGTQAAEALQKSDGTDQKAITTKLAAQLSQWALDGTLSGYLMTIVDKLPSSANLKEGEKIILAQQIQVMLLASVLAGLYKLQYGGVTAKEFMDVLAKPIVVDSPHAQVLAALIVNTLSSDELPIEAKSRLARSLNIYLDTDPNLPTLFDLGETASIQLSILHSSQT